MKYDFKYNIGDRVIFENYDWWEGITYRTVGTIAAACINDINEESYNIVTDSGEDFSVMVDLIKEVIK